MRRDSCGSTPFTGWLCCCLSEKIEAAYAHFLFILYIRCIVVRLDAKEVSFQSCCRCHALLLLPNTTEVESRVASGSAKPVSTFMYIHFDLRHSHCSTVHDRQRLAPFSGALLSFDFVWWKHFHCGTPPAPLRTGGASRPPLVPVLV